MAVAVSVIVTALLLFSSAKSVVATFKRTNVGKETSIVLLSGVVINLPPYKKNQKETKSR
ncbi:Uncharacterised protein [Chlamydia trachomatis]|nr:Uncharacterised protein [Chlamydia trachomatis]